MHKDQLEAPICLMTSKKSFIVCPIVLVVIGCYAEHAKLIVTIKKRDYFLRNLRFF